MGEDEVGRRAFLVRMAALAFGIPVVSSFALEGVAYANERDCRQHSGNQTQNPKPVPVGYTGNQGYPTGGPGQYGGNQTSGSKPSKSKDCGPGQHHR